jgi:hypothetical protein
MPAGLTPEQQQQYSEAAQQYINSLPTTTEAVLAARAIAAAPSADQQALDQLRAQQMMLYTMQQGTGIAPGGALTAPTGSDGTTPAAVAAPLLSGIPGWAWTAAAGAVLVSMARKKISL